MHADFNRTQSAGVLILDNDKKENDEKNEKEKVSHDTVTLRISERSAGNLEATFPIMIGNLSSVVRVIKVQTLPDLLR